MTEKSRTIDDVNFPPLKFYDFLSKNISIDEYGYEHEMYLNWYHKHIVDNYQLNTRVFILRDPSAIRIFENIINGDDFFKHILLFLDEFKPLKVFIYENFPELIYKESPFCEKINLCLAEVFTANIIIPEKYKTISEYDIEGCSELVDFFRNDPIKINFQKEINERISMVRMKKSRRVKSRSFSFRSF